MRVGSVAHAYVEGFTCVLCGLRAYSRVNVRVTARVGLSEPRTGPACACVSSPCARDCLLMRALVAHVAGIAQNADYFTPNSPFSSFFGEVVCVVGTAPFRQVPRRGGLHYKRARHAGDTPAEGFV